MKSLKIDPGLLPSIIKVPASKSYANRALILAALKAAPFTISNLPKATDVTFLLEALEKIGLIISRPDEGCLRVDNSFPACEHESIAEIYVGEGGTTARFLACMLSLGSLPYTLILGDRLKDRPWDEFISAFSKMGVKIHLESNKLFIQGPLKTDGEVEVDCTRTTQFASGMQMALAAKSIKVTPLNLKSSISYWQMTEKLIEDFRTQNAFKIPLDWSSASYPLAFGALKQEIFLPQLFPDALQADAKFLHLLQDLGAISLLADGVLVRPVNKMKDINLDISDCLDLAPALAFFLSHIDGSHRLSGIENLVYKESNRLQEIEKLLKHFHKKVSSNGKELFIGGSSSFNSGPLTLKLPDDHRLVMSAGLFLRAHGGGEVAPIEAADKSYPDFQYLLR
jgi:3-phosphoshikimate 1-carboxyvinyltransferase